MKYSIGLLVIIPIILISLSSFKMKPEEVNEKIILSSLIPTNRVIDSLAANITGQIGKKQFGHQWPVTKMVFSKANGKTHIDITAIDNSWFQLFSPKENPYGHFVVNNRLFIVSTKGEEQIELSRLFRKTNQKRSFDKPDMMIMLYKEMPTWSYHFDENRRVQLINTKYLEHLNKAPK